MKKLQVGVLLGGMSIEREVAFNSGRTVCDHLDTEIYDVIPLFQSAQGNLYILPFSFLYRGKIADFQDRLHEAQEVFWDNLPQLIDFMYIATHGAYAEDGRLQGMLEMLKIPYLGSKVFASSLNMNKRLHKEFLHHAGIIVPQGFSLFPEQIKNFSLQAFQEQLSLHKISYPFVVKPSSEGSSFGVSVVKSEDMLRNALQNACFVSNQDGQEILIEQYIQGMEFTCILITDYVNNALMPLPITEVIINKNTSIFDYKQKYMPGRVFERTPAVCSQEDTKRIQDTCMKAMQVLEFENLSRIDGFLMEDGTVCIIDCNALSGMGPATFLFRQAAEVGINHAQLINHLIKTELKHYDMNIAKPQSSEPTKKIRIGVLMGGPSNEREISLESGRNVCYKLSPEKYEILPLYVDKNMKLFHMNFQLLVHNSTREIENNLDKAAPIRWADLKNVIDFALIALHGAPGENGVLQGALEMLQIPYNGPSIFTSALCMDKYKTTKYLAAKGFAVPRGILFSKSAFMQENADAILQNFLDQSQGSCIIKPHDDGCSVLVQKADSLDEMKESLLALFEQKDLALIEECIIGTELTVGVVGNEHPRALAPSQAVARKGVLSMEEKFLPGAGENQTPALLPQEDIDLVRKVMVEVFTAINGQGYSRIDCFFQNELQSPTGKKRVVILEINTLPGLTPATCIFHQAAEEGLRPSDFLNEIIDLGFKRYQQHQVVSIDEALERQDKLIYFN